MEFGKDYYDFCKKDNNFDMDNICGWHDGYYNFLKNVFSEHMKPEMISLDVGCATGNYLELFRRKGKTMHGCDVSPWYIENCKFPKIKERMRVIANNQIPFLDEMFDFIHVCQVVEHIPEQFIHEEMKEIFRTLKPGGIVYISTVGEGPAIPPPGEDPTHISCFSREKWERIFKECGFGDVSVNYVDRFKNDPFASTYDWVNFVLTK